MKRQCRQKVQGISLMGLLTAVSISAILVVISIPSFSYYINKHKISDLTRQLVEALYVTKQLAIVRGQVHYFNLSSSESLVENSNGLTSTKSCWVISAVQHCHCLTSTVACQSYYGRTLSNVNTISITVNRPSLSFSPLFGKTNGATYQLALERFVVKVIVSSQGRIRVCMASGESASYAAC